MVEEILEEKKIFDRIIFRYCNRKYNKVAEYLAMFAHNFVEDYYWTDK